MNAKTLQHTIYKIQKQLSKRNLYFFVFIAVVSCTFEAEKQGRSYTIEGKAYYTDVNTYIADASLEIKEYNIPPTKTDSRGAFAIKNVRLRADDETIILGVKPLETKGFTYVTVPLPADFSKSNRTIALGQVDFPIKSSSLESTFNQTSVYKPANPNLTNSSTTPTESKSEDNNTKPDNISKIANQHIFNSADRADIAVMAIADNQAALPGLAQSMANIFRQKGLLPSASFFQRAFVGQGYFNKIFNGQTILLNNLSLKQNINHVCLLIRQVNYKTHEDTQGLITAYAQYTVKIYSTTLAKETDSRVINITGPGFTESAALQEADLRFLEELNNISFNY